MQTLAIELLMFADNIRRGEDRSEELRMAMIASGNYDPASLLPGGIRVLAAQDDRRGMSVARPEDATADAAGDPLEDYSEVQWESPSTAGEEGVMSDLEKFNAAMAANANISVSGEDEGGEWL